MGGECNLIALKQLILTMSAMNVASRELPGLILWGLEKNQVSDKSFLLH